MLGAGFLLADYPLRISMNIFDGHPCAVSVEPGEKNKHDERGAHTGLRGLVLPH